MLFELRDIKSLLLFFPSGVLLYEIQTFKWLAIYKQVIIGYQYTAE